MKKLLLSAVAFVVGINNMNSQTCAAARAAGVGANVTVRAVAINGQELGSIRYVQDVTGGIAAYGGNLSSINRGDSLVISGPLTEYYNLYEITPATYVFISANATLPIPKIITPSQFGEAQEGQLIKILNCTFTGASGNFPATATNYTVTANSQTFAVRSNTALGGTPIPTTPVDIIGVGSQFCGPINSSGCNTGYQLLPRNTNDFSAATQPTGIEEINRNTVVSVFPNPATHTINFKLGNNEEATSVLVTDVLGKTIYVSKENINTIDVSSFNKGFYNLFISTGKNNFQSKFIVEKQ
jgi:hypothetical protein